MLVCSHFVHNNTVVYDDDFVYDNGVMYDDGVVYDGRVSHNVSVAHQDSAVYDDRVLYDDRDMYDDGSSTMAASCTENIGIGVSKLLGSYVAGGYRYGSAHQGGFDTCMGHQQRE